MQTHEPLGAVSRTFLAERMRDAAINGLFTKNDINLDQVDNTSDANKPISNDTLAALQTKVDKTTTINSLPLTGPLVLGRADIGLPNVDDTSDANKPVSSATQLALDFKVNNDRAINGYLLGDGNITLNKSDIGLSLVDNTSDINKPLSTATTTALSAKVNTTTTINGKTLNTASVTLTPSDLGAQVTPSPGAIALWDPARALRANNLVCGVTSTATSATTVSLTVNSTQNQVFTGSVAQNVNLPDATTLQAGTVYDFHNSSSQTITVFATNGSTTITSIPPSAHQRVTLTSNGSANGTWAATNRLAPNQIVVADSSGVMTSSSNTQFTIGTVCFSNSGLNNVFNFAIGGLNQSNNTANTATVLNVRSPGGDVRGVAFQLNSGNSCQIISEYSGGGVVSNFAIWRGSVKMLNFYTGTLIQCNVTFQAPTLSVTSTFQTSPTTFTASGTITTPVSICNASSAITLTLPASPSTGQNVSIVNLATSIVNVSGIGLQLGLNDSVDLIYDSVANWVVLRCGTVFCKTNNFNTVTTSTTVWAPTTIVNTTSPTTQTLPNASEVPVGKIYTVTNNNSGSVTVVAPGRPVDVVLTTNQSVRFCSTGSIWFIS